MSLNVLIVDDSAVMRSMLAKTLHVAGVDIGEIHQASNGQEGMEVLGERWIDLVLVDINMPVGNQINRCGVLPQFDLRVTFQRIQQRPFDLMAGSVRMMHDPMLAVTAFASEGEAAILFAEFRTPFHQPTDLARPLADHDLDNFFLAQPGASFYGVMDVRVERVSLPHDGSDSALGIVCVALHCILFCDNSNCSKLSCPKRKVKPGYAAANNKEICFHKLA